MQPLELVIETTRNSATWVHPSKVLTEGDGPSLASDRDFFVGKSILELAQSQGVAPVEDIGVFAGGLPEDEDLDEMLDEIYRLRRL